jgi:GNAT superfamily N-acetyltransferase
MNRPRMAIRPAVDDDLPAIRSILATHGNDGPIIHGDIVGPYLGHLLAHGRALVADQDDAVVGFAAAIDTGRGWHLADLFVRVDQLGQGIGRPLLDAVFEGVDDRTTFASADPRALPLYVRAGMTPMWPSLYVEGAATDLPDTDRLPATEPSSAATIAALERAWTGQDRGADHAFWATQFDADSFIVRVGGDVVGAGHARARQASPLRALDRLLVHREADPVPVVLAAIRRAGRDGGVFVCIQGPSPVLRALLDVGFRIADQDTYMASRPDLIDPARLVPSSGMR